MKNIKYFNEAWDPIKKEWEKTADGQNDYSSKDAHYYHKDEIAFLWNYDTKDLHIIPNSETQKKYKTLRPIHIDDVDSKEDANNIIGMLVDKPYTEWEKILNDQVKIKYSVKPRLDETPNE